MCRRKRRAVPEIVMTARQSASLPVSWHLCLRRGPLLPCDAAAQANRHCDAARQVVLSEDANLAELVRPLTVADAQGALAGRGPRPCVIGGRRSR